MALTKPDVAVLVERMPDADSPGKASKFTGPDPEKAERIFAEILEGGRESLLDLIGLIRLPADPQFKNYKAEYVLHGLAVHVGRRGAESQRRMFAETLAARLTGNPKLSKGLRGVLIRQLHVAGGPEVVETLGAQLGDGELCEDAAQALIAIGRGAAAPLRKALSNAAGRSRVTIIQALGVLRDAESASALKRAVRDDARDVRIAAAWALANIADPSAAGAILAAADAAEGWERIQADKACLLLAERLAAAGRKDDAVRIYAHLRDRRTGSGERYVREVARRALGASN